MFNEEFYPTPPAVIEKMLEPFQVKSRNQERSYYSLGERIVLEPSAGKGDFLDYLTGKFEVSYRELSGNRSPTYSDKLVDPKKIYCCEQEAELKYILQSKGYRVIADDFLNYSGDYYFDLILMNPPFSNGDQHLLKAWSILDKGDVICLLNAETIRNPFSERRRHIVQLIEQHGSVEYLGNAFSTAERKTDVEIALVRLHKKATESPLDFQFENAHKEKHFSFDESTLNDAPALKDVVGNMMIQYDKIKEGFVEYMRLAAQLNHYGAPLVYIDRDGNKDTPLNIFQIAQDAYQEGKTKRESFNIFCDRMKANMWRIVFKNINNIASFDMEKFMTHRIRTSFSEFTTKQGQLDFTRENVWNFITMLHENKANILETAIVEVFDMFTTYYSENRSYVEGWKTNDKWKVNRKIILPNGVSFGRHDDANWTKKYGSSFDIYYDNHSRYSDIDKALDYIVGGRKTGLPGIYEALTNHFHRLGKVKTGETFDNTGTSAYFDYKFWRKGTLHLTFKDEALWQEFNMRACSQRGWLPENEKREWEQSKKPVQPEPAPRATPTGQLLLI